MRIVKQNSFMIIYYIMINERVKGNMKEFYVNKDTCAKDYKCTKVCALGLIAINDKTGYPEFVDNINELCMDCGHCSAVCSGLISRSSKTNLEKSIKTGKISKNDFGKYLKSRRSVRTYKLEDVSSDVLTEIINSANWQPSACNQEYIEWIVLNSREKIRELAGLVIEWFRKCGQAPTIIEAWDNGKDPIFCTAPSVIICHTSTASVLPVYDAAIATTGVDLTLPVYGLGGCWAGLFMLASLNRRISKDIYDFLRIPEGHRIYTGLMVGYPAVAYDFIPNRKQKKIKFI
jgi:nitroreductase